MRTNRAKQQPLVLLAAVFLLTLVGGILPIPSRAAAAPDSPRQQGPKRPGEDVPQGPKRPGVIETAEIPKAIRIPKTPQKGSLVLFTTPQANVKLVAKFGRKQAVMEKMADGKGLCLFPSLSPGSYELRITGDEYQSLTDTITIEKNKPTGLNGTLLSKFGTLILALPEQEVSGVSVWLDGDQLASSLLKPNGDTIKIARIAVGKHQIKLIKANFDDWSQQIEVRPGEVAENKISLAMKRATITLLVKALPQADVYINNLLRGAIGNEGMLRIPDLLPDTYTLKVKLAGYQSVERTLLLSLDQRDVTAEVKLFSILETGEFDLKFTEESQRWTTRPPEWKLATGNQSGLQAAGDLVALVNDTSIPNLPFNHYGDFRLVLNVKLVNGKGASWIVRAQDERNYYLFELAVMSGQNRENTWNFYVYRDGKPTRKVTFPVMAEIGKPDTSVRIFLEARENKFTVKIDGQGDRGRGPEFTDNTYRYGGIGLCAINGLEMFITELKIIPSK